MHLIDTNVAIHLRDVDPIVTARVAAMPGLPCLSMMSWVELEGGVSEDPSQASRRRIHLDRLLAALDVKPLDAAVIGSYRAIVAASGFSRRKVIDRLIAATAIVNDLTLVTINADDFGDIPGLKLEIWPAPQ